MLSFRRAPVLVVLALATSAQAQYTVLPDTVDGVAKPNMMLTYLNNQVAQADQTWQTTFDSINTPAQLAAYQAKQRAVINAELGNFAGFPDPASVNLGAQVTGTMDFNGYKVEKILMQTMPGLYQTANLYIPTKPEYVGHVNPAVLMTTGHWQASKAEPSMTNMCALLALNGMVSLIVDPIDQGERLQSGPTWGVQSHQDAAVSNDLVGRNAATWMAWDNMRAIDYLQSRPEVQADKIGVTGASGGGAQTAFVMAIDDRIKAAVPNSWTTTWKDVLLTPALGSPKVAMGPQDPEQNLHASFQHGLDHPDLIVARTIPVQISANTDDFFVFSGTQATYDNVQALYAKMGPEYADKVELSTLTGYGHGYHKPLRESAAEFFAKHLRGEIKDIVEPTLSTISTEQARVTPTGQVKDLPGYKSTYQLNVEYDQNVLAPQRSTFWQNNPLSTKLSKVREIAAIRTLSSLPEVTVGDYGTIARTNYRIDKKCLTVDAGMYLPALMFVPNSAPNGAVIYVNDGGKAVEANVAQRLEQLALSGKVVLALDLAGMGETKQIYEQMWGNPAEIGIDQREVATAYMLGKSMVGYRAENIVSAAEWLISQEQANGIDKVDLLSVGNASGISALHAAALQRELFDNCTFENNLGSWTTLLAEPSSSAAPYNLQYQSIVNGALLYYDLPDLLNVINTPEPTSMVLLAGGACLLLRRTRREA